MTQLLTVATKTCVTLPAHGGRPATKHVFEEDAIDAINAALAAKRPLLVRGEPGTGKSQLARAAAVQLGRAFVSKVIDVRTEARDLLWTFDAVRRLAVAQIEGALPNPKLDKLDEANFVSPGPLWWGLHWSSALEQAARVGVDPPDTSRDGGAVVLLDEMDKADSSVPNGLLEILGEGRFDVAGRAGVVHARGVAPLIVITTNEERVLPDAFLRRCMVLRLPLGEPLGPWLVERGRAHFETLETKILEDAAQMLAEDRAAMKARGLSPPGQAEYLDLLRALDTLAPNDPKKQSAWMAKLRTYAFRKHPEEERA